MRKTTLVIAGALVLGAFFPPPPLCAQNPQAELARVLAEGTRYEQAVALAEITGMDRTEISPGLRLALINALDREVAVRAEVRRGARIPVEYPELLARLALIVSAFDDPRSINGLAGALGRAPIAIDALTEFGDPAALAVLEVVFEGGAGAASEQDGLVALRQMVERQGAGALSSPVRNRIHELAATYLEGGRHVTLFWRAIDLAAALDDPALNDTLRLLATNEAALVARGIANRDLARTQRMLSDRLAGIPASRGH